MPRRRRVVEQHRAHRELHSERALNSGNHASSDERVTDEFNEDGVRARSASGDAQHAVPQDKKALEYIVSVAARGHAKVAQRAEGERGSARTSGAAAVPTTKIYEGERVKSLAGLSPQSTGNK